MILRVAVTGDDDADAEAIAVTIDAIRDAANDLRQAVDARWVMAAELDDDLLTRVHAVVVATSAPDRHDQLVEACRRTSTPLLVTGLPSADGTADLDEVRVPEGSRARASYLTDRVIEAHPGPRALAPVPAGLVVSGHGSSGDARLAEHPGPSFLLVSSFAPQLSSNPGRPHVLFTALVVAAAS